MVTTPAKGNVVAAVADDIRGRGSELREKHDLMERTTVVMDAVVVGNSVSVVGVAKEREIEIEREDRRERETQWEEEKGSAAAVTSSGYRFSAAIPPRLHHRRAKNTGDAKPSSTRTHRCHCMSCRPIAVWWFFLLTITDLSPIRVY
ncbi:hypothetical protein PIB30_069406 [Stylosanthes scabra]|uniref:Uncharacterized protein n=1 Tax=Stylosanthes scabra TaxID=79078 RepID=A0ABU6UM01_9FABA|nr:hypothetical protein [Stylosanthes scabra]